MAELYNISNHLSLKWSPEMLHEGMKLGDPIVDVPYPRIPTDADDEEVRYLAAKFLGKLDIPEGAPVYIQGEMSSLFAMVNMLQELGHDCYTATSERRIWEKADGTTTRKFEFVRFRKYPCFWEEED